MKLTFDDIKARESRHVVQTYKRQPIAFVRGNNLFVVDVAMRREAPITTDGSEKVLNGKLDLLQG